MTRGMEEVERSQEEVKEKSEKGVTIRSPTTEV